MTIHEGAGGWNSSVWGWEDMSDEGGITMQDGSTGFYEPLNSGLTNTSLGTGTRKAAIREAHSWAKHEEPMPLYIPGCTTEEEILLLAKGESDDA